MLEASRPRVNTLAQVSMKLGEAMYKQQAEADAAKDAAKDDVDDAEFTEVDDDKNDKKSAKRQGIDGHGVRWLRDDAPGASPGAWGTTTMPGGWRAHSGSTGCGGRSMSAKALLLRDA